MTTTGARFTFHRELNRREFLRMAALAVPAVSLYPMAFESSEVKTPSGTLRGSVEGGVRVFRGVPFAQPPGGRLRFRPTEKLQPWSGVRDALRFAPAASQPANPKFTQSEDCLYLNIWVPEGRGPFPILVWIHGGGFTGGTAFDASQNGAHFANAGIVCVTVAYRLGVFGFLDVSPLLGASYAGSGSNGLRDGIEALRWVQRNIEAFGGDPARVTVGGESAGAKLTDTLMGVPEAPGLFASMISESGGAERLWPETEAKAVAEGFGRTWTGSRKATAAIETAPAEELIAAQEAFTDSWPKHFPLRPELHAPLLPRLPVETIAAGSTKGKRLLIGTNLDESALFVGPHPATVTADELGNMPLPRFLEIYEQYRHVYPEMTDVQRRIRALTAEEYWIPSMRVADAHLAGGGTAWMYRLNYAPVAGRLRGFPYHSEDVRLVWDDEQPATADAGALRALGTQMHAAWVAFIKGETPAADGLPPWPRYNRQTRPTMILNRQSRVVDAPGDEEFRLWEGVL